MMSKLKAAIAGYLVTIFLCMLSSGFCQEVPIQLSTEKITDNIYMISGDGGNTGVFVGENDILMVDTKTEPVAEELKKEIIKISTQPIRFIVNTHWHFDHVGGNEILASAGTMIISHVNVYNRLIQEQYLEFFDSKVPPAPKSALPDMTFTKDMTLYLDEEKIELIHIEPGHTDFDAAVFFSNSNVIHMGDLFFNGYYPYIGISSGGSINFMITVINQILPMIDSATIVIPGHGPLSNKAELKEYVHMLDQIRNTVDPLIQSGKTLEELLEIKPTQVFDEKWGNGFLKPDRFTKLVYKDLKRAK